MMKKAESSKGVFAHPVRKLSAQELQKISGGYESEESVLRKLGGGYDYTTRQGFE